MLVQSPTASLTALGYQSPEAFGGQPQLTQHDALHCSWDGYIVEAEANGASSFVPIGTVGANATEFLATNLTANQQYLFKVIAYNSQGQGDPSAAGGDPTTGDPVTIGGASAAGWYKVSFNDPSNPTATSESFQPGSTEYTDTGTLTLANSGWIQADWEADAVRQALSGAIFTSNRNANWVFGQSGALQFNPDLQNGDTDVGPAIGVEDLFNSSGHGDHDYNDAYVPLTVVQDGVWAQAMTTTPLPPPSGYTAVGRFGSEDTGSSSSEFSAEVDWANGDTTAAHIEAEGNGYFDLSVPSVPSGASTSDYQLVVTHTATGVSDYDINGAASPDFPPPGGGGDGGGGGTVTPDIPKGPQMVSVGLTGGPRPACKLER